MWFYASCLDVIKLNRGLGRTLEVKPFTCKGSVAFVPCENLLSKHYLVIPSTFIFAKCHAESKYLEPFGSFWLLVMPRWAHLFAKGSQETV